jgi:hypothetical protein
VDRPRPSGLTDVIDVILDKGIVIDAFVRVSLVGIEAPDHRRANRHRQRRYLSAVRRRRQPARHRAESTSQGLPELMESIPEGVARSKVKGLTSGAKEAIKDL